MLREAWSWLITPCPAAARRLGYLRESIATAARARRCREAWAPHLEHTRQLILAEAGGGQHLRILGAGLIHDLPLAELAERYERIDLVDWVFAKATRRLAARFPRVCCREQDVTGIAAALCAAGSPEAVEDLLANPEPDEEAELVLSLNLLSQLPLLPLEHLARRFPQVDETRLNAWGLRLMERHLQRLARAPRALLIADAVQQERDASGALVAERNYGEHFGYAALAIAAWDWQLAPAGESADGRVHRHRVVACRLGRQQD